MSLFALSGPRAIPPPVGSLPRCHLLVLRLGIVLAGVSSKLPTISWCGGSWPNAPRKPDRNLLPPSVDTRRFGYAWLRVLLLLQRLATSLMTPRRLRLCGARGLEPSPFCFGVYRPLVCAWVIKVWSKKGSQIGPEITPN